MHELMSQGSHRRLLCLSQQMDSEHSGQCTLLLNKAGHLHHELFEILVTKMRNQRLWISDSSSRSLLRLLLDRRVIAASLQVVADIVCSECSRFWWQDCELTRLLTL